MMQIPRPYAGPPFSTAAPQVPLHRFRGRDLEAPFRAVRAVPGTTSTDRLDELAMRQALVALCAAYSVRAGVDEFFSHVTAARTL